MFKRLSVVLLGVMISFVMSTSVFADWKSVNGAACQAFNGSHEKYLRHWGTGVVNRSNRNVMVTCPLVADTEYSRLIGVKVVIGQPPESMVRCYLQNSSEDGSVNTIRKSGTGDVVLTWQNATSGYYKMSAVRCLLPPGARLARVNYDENGYVRD